MTGLRVFVNATVLTMEPGAPVAERSPSATAGSPRWAPGRP